jgi:uncharacterized protein
MSELSTTARQHLDTIGRAFAGIAEFDADKMLENYSDDLVLEVPYADPPLMLNGKPTILKFLRGAFKIFHFSIDITDVYELADPTMLILEYTSKGTITTTGKHYANRYVGVYWFRDDKICHVREYLNPAITAKALEP